MSEASKWEIVDGLEVPCADISFNWPSGPGAQLDVLMHFSRVVEGIDADVRLIFANAMHMAWEDESLGLLDLPDKLPYCLDSEFSDWVFPTLIIKNSPLATKYADKAFAADDPSHAQVRHFVLISMNDLVHVISADMPVVEMVQADAL
tara:strand:- start:145 stop:588 length:444 start_codon:yes stop_codon:yes gene_type:complete